MVPALLLVGQGFLALLATVSTFVVTGFGVAIGFRFANSLADKFVAKRQQMIANRVLDQNGIGNAVPA